MPYIINFSAHTILDKCFSSVAIPPPQKILFYHQSRKEISEIRIVRIITVPQIFLPVMYVYRKYDTDNEAETQCVVQMSRGAE